VLVASGFEVFRTLQQEIVLADRVRENLILDSGVRVGPGDEGKLRLRLVFRAHRADFPSDDEKTLFEKVRKLAAPALAKGFAEDTTAVTNVTDPSDPQKTLDTHYELFLRHDVGSVDEAVPLLKFALGLEKAVGR
jgi:hypothetical protein